MMRHSPETHFLLLCHTDVASSRSGRRIHCSLSPLMYKAKAYLRYGRDTVCSERWQWQPKQQSNIPFQRLWSSKDTTCIKDMDTSWGRESDNGKRTRKRTWPICSSGAQERNVVHCWTLTVGNSQGVLLFHKRRSNWCRGDWSRQKSTQLDMGMEIPCILTFTCEDLHILDKAKELLARKDFKPKDQLKAEGHLVTVNFKGVKPTRAEKKSQTEEPQKKRPRKK